MGRIINPFAFASSVNLGSRDFTLANSEYFTRSLANAVNPGNSDFWFSIWCYFDSIPSGGGNNRGLATSWSKVSDLGDRCWLCNAVNVTGSNPIIRVMLRDAADSANTTFDHSTNISASTWYHVFWYHDSVNNEVGIALNGGSFETSGYTGGVNTGSITPFLIGWTNSGGNGEYMDGQLLNLGFGQIPTGTMNSLAVTIKNAMYNSGNALYWEDITSTQKVDWGLTNGNGVWYPLNEENTGDDAIEKVAGLTATDVNTVGVSSNVP